MAKQTQPYGPDQNLPDLELQKQAKNPMHDAITGAVFGGVAGSFVGASVGAKVLGKYTPYFLQHYTPMHAGPIDVYSLPPLLVSWLHYHAHYPMINQPTAIALAVTAAVGAVGAYFGYQRSAKARYLLEHSDIHGSAKWATIGDVRDAALLPRKSEKASPYTCYVGGFRENNTIRYLRHTGTEHIIAFAPTRSGKGVGLVLPTLFAWRDSVVVNDIKGENYELTAGYRRKIGNRVLRFAPGELDTRGAHFNPLDEVRIGTDYEIKDVMNIATMIVDPDGKGLNDHWAKTGFALLTSVILHVLYAEPDKTLRGVAAYLNDPELEHVDDAFAAMMGTEHDPDGSHGWRDQRGEPTRIHPVIAQSAREVLNKADNEKSGVISTMNSFLSLYRDPIVASWTEYSDFRISDLQDANDAVSLFLCQSPEDKNRLKPLIRLVLNQIASKFTSAERLVAVEGRMKCVGKHRLMLLLDEFPSLGKMDVFLDSIAFFAGYNVKLYLITQDYSQLEGEEHGYGRAGAKAIVGNCHVRVIYAPNQIETAEWVSKMLGKRTITSLEESQSYSGSLVTQAQGGSRSYRHQGRDLLTPDEVMTMRGPKKDGDKIIEPGDMLVLVAGFSPIYGQQMLYFHDKTFLARAKTAAPLHSDILRLPPPEPADLPVFVKPKPKNAEAEAAEMAALPQGEADAKSADLLGQLGNAPAAAEIDAQAGSHEAEKSAESGEKTESDDKTAAAADADPLAALEAVNAQAKTESDAGRREKAGDRDADRKQIEGLL